LKSVGLGVEDLGDRLGRRRRLAERLGLSADHAGHFVDLHRGAVDVHGGGWRNRNAAPEPYVPHCWRGVNSLSCQEAVSISHGVTISKGMAGNVSSGMRRIVPLAFALAEARDPSG
jgi:hypothetical protein